MAEQLVFALVEEEPPTFANFVAVGNAEAELIKDAQKNYKDGLAFARQARKEARKL